MYIRSLLALLVQKYKSTSTAFAAQRIDAARRRRRARSRYIYTQFTCFTGAKVQSLTLQTSAEQATRIYTQFTCFTEILTQQASAEQATRIYTQFTCITGTKVQILTQQASAEQATLPPLWGTCSKWTSRNGTRRYSVYLLYD